MTPLSSTQKPGVLARLAHFTVNHRRPVMLVWLIIAFAAAPLALSLTNALSGAGWEAQGVVVLQVVVSAVALEVVASVLKLPLLIEVEFLKLSF